MASAIGACIIACLDQIPRYIEWHRAKKEGCYFFWRGLDFAFAHYSQLTSNVKPAHDVSSDCPGKRPNSLAVAPAHIPLLPEEGENSDQHC